MNDRIEEATRIVRGREYPPLRGYLRGRTDRVEAYGVGMVDLAGGWGAPVWRCGLCGGMRLTQLRRRCGCTGAESAI